MKTLTEADLRAALLAKNVREYRVQAGTFVTPLAKEYLRDHHIELIVCGEGEGAAHGPMTRTHVEARGGRTFVDAQTGEGYRVKPERMTHLRANLLVPKTHPRIVFRGKLDTLQGEILVLQAEAQEKGFQKLVSDLGEVLALVQAVLGAEVTERPLGAWTLFGLDADGVRKTSHRVKEEFGFEHPIPELKMGRLALALNLLRAKSREAEVACEAAFAEQSEREDLLLAMNRLSSGIYILFCRLLAGQYGN